MIVRMHHAPFAKKLRGKRTVKENTVLEMRNIHKSFPGVRALKGVDFTLCEGEIHALMGENGAGKSTLIKVLTGVYGKDEGQVYIKGQAQAVSIRSPQDAQKFGISTVYQEITLCPNLSVAENMYEIKDLPRVKLVSKMLGKELDDVAEIKDDSIVYKAKTDIPVFEAEGLQSNAGIKPFNFYIKKGEVNGFTGLLGSGRSECVRAIFGADKVIRGTVKKNGKAVKITKPIDAMRQGIAYLPEDRKRDGIIGDLSVRDNIILALQVMKGFFRPFSKAEANKFAEEYIKLLSIKTASADTPIKSLSGGNQQKVILARWLLTKPEYLILDEPTRGIDIGTKIDIQKLVLKLASEGMSVTFISSETDEMLRTCSRLIVMRDRKVVGELSDKELSQSMIMNTIAGGEK